MRPRRVPYHSALSPTSAPSARTTFFLELFECLPPRPPALKHGHEQCSRHRQQPGYRQGDCGAAVKARLHCHRPRHQRQQRRQHRSRFRRSPRAANAVGRGAPPARRADRRAGEQCRLVRTEPAPRQRYRMAGSLGGYHADQPHQRRAAQPLCRAPLAGERKGRAGSSILPAAPPIAGICLRTGTMPPPRAGWWRCTRVLLGAMPAKAF